jgi:hypothetical protein
MKWCVCFSNLLLFRGFSRSDRSRSCVRIIANGKYKESRHWKSVRISTSTEQYTRPPLRPLLKKKSAWELSVILNPFDEKKSASRLHRRQRATSKPSSEMVCLVLWALLAAYIFLRWCSSYKWLWYVWTRHETTVVVIAFLVLCAERELQKCKWLRWGWDFRVNTLASLLSCHH